MRNLIIAFLLILVSSCGTTKQQKVGEDIEKIKVAKVDSIFDASLVDLKFISESKVLHLKIPNKQTASDINSIEFIKYKNGYIINSLATYSDVQDKGVDYNYYFFDVAKRELYKIKIAGIDSVESIVTIDENLYLSWKAHGKAKITRIQNGKAKNISLTTDDNSYPTLSDTNWIKLGKYNKKLFALKPNGAFYYTGNSWKVVSHFDLKDYLKLHSLGSDVVIPTENIKVASNKIYFLQEVLEDRESYLFELDLHKNQLNELWTKLKIDDNYAKQVNSYTILGTDSVLIAADRLELGSLILLRNNNFKTLILNGEIQSHLNGKNKIKVKAIFNHENKTTILAENGLYELKDKTIKPLIYFENTNQLIKYNKTSNYHYDFIPRCCELLQDNVYLIGGQFGGLIILDLNKEKVQCFDDKENLKTLDLTK